MILFVYGSLRKGQYNHIRYEIDMRRLVFLGMGKTKPEFTLVDFGPYPGLYAGGSTAVVGELYELDAEHHMAKCIEYMEVGAGYRQQDITLEDGRVVTAYVQRGSIPSYCKKRCTSGDWNAHHIPTEHEASHMASQLKWMIEFAHEEALEYVKRNKPKRGKAKCKSN